MECQSFAQAIGIHRTREQEVGSDKMGITKYFSPLVGLKLLLGNTMIILITQQYFKSSSPHLPSTTLPSSFHIQDAFFPRRRSDVKSPTPKILPFPHPASWVNTISSVASFTATLISSTLNVENQSIESSWILLIEFMNKIHFSGTLPGFDC